MKKDGIFTSQQAAHQRKRKRVRSPRLEVHERRGHRDARERAGEVHEPEKDLTEL